MAPCFRRRYAAARGEAHEPLAFSALFVICVLTASAEALDKTDFDCMNNLIRKAIQLQQDMLNVQEGNPLVGKGSECLNELYHNLETTFVRIKGLHSLVQVASLMMPLSFSSTWTLVERGSI